VRSSKRRYTSINQTLCAARPFNEFKRPEIVTIPSHLIGKAGLTRTSGATGAVTLVQRFGSALNLNVHFHSRWPASAWR